MIAVDTRVKVDVPGYEWRVGTVTKVGSDWCDVLLDNTHNQKAPTSFRVRADTLVVAE